MGKKRSKYNMGGSHNNRKRYPNREFRPTVNLDFTSLEIEQRKDIFPVLSTEVLRKNFNFGETLSKNTQSNPLPNFEPSIKYFHGTGTGDLCRRPVHPALGASDNSLGEMNQRHHAVWNINKFGCNPSIFGGTPNFQNPLGPEMNCKSKAAVQFNFADISSDSTWWETPITVTNNISSQNKLIKESTKITSSTATSYIPINRRLTVNMNNYATNKSPSKLTVPIVNNQESKQEDDVIYLFTVDSSANGRIIEEINLCQASESVDLIAPKAPPIELIDLSKESKTYNVTLPSPLNLITPPATLTINSKFNNPASSSQIARKRKKDDEVEKSSKRQNVKYLQIKCSACKIDYEALAKTGKEMYIAASCGHSYCYSCARKDEKKVCSVCGSKVSTFCRQYL